MDRRSFIGSILALAAAPAIVRASSLMGFKEAARPILLPASAGDIIIANEMPPAAFFDAPGKPRQYWPGADLAADYGAETADDIPMLCTRPDGILVMAPPTAIRLSQTMGMPLTPVGASFKILDYRYPPAKARTPRVVEAQSRFNFVLGTFR